ncbi:MAG: hypothetical protein M1136_11190 [Chloroflexi bacterium]|nr:hypothetical protein [Chloroflexota bacterium]
MRIHVVGGLVSRVNLYPKDWMRRRVRIHVALGLAPAWEVSGDKARTLRAPSPTSAVIFSYFAVPLATGIRVFILRGVPCKWDMADLGA